MQSEVDAGTEEQLCVSCRQLEVLPIPSADDFRVTMSAEEPAGPARRLLQQQQTLSPVGDSWDPVGGKSQDGRRILGRAFTHSDAGHLRFRRSGVRETRSIALHEPVMRMSTSLPGALSDHLTNGGSRSAARVRYFRAAQLVESASSASGPLR